MCDALSVDKTILIILSKTFKPSFTLQLKDMMEVIQLIDEVTLSLVCTDGQEMTKARMVQAELA